MEPRVCQERLGASGALQVPSASCEPALALLPGNRMSEGGAGGGVCAPFQWVKKTLCTWGLFLLYHIQSISGILHT